MTFEQALAAISAEYPFATDDQTTTDTVLVSPLGVLGNGKDLPVDDEVAPVLYISKELAISDFAIAAKRVLGEREATAFRFTDGPHLDRYVVSMQGDRGGTFRVVRPRYTVVATLGIIRKAASEPAQPAETETVTEPKQNVVRRSR